MLVMTWSVELVSPGRELTRRESQRQWAPYYLYFRLQPSPTPLGQYNHHPTPFGQYNHHPLDQLLPQLLHWPSATQRSLLDFPVAQCWNWNCKATEHEERTKAVKKRAKYASAQMTEASSTCFLSRFALLAFSRQLFADGMAGYFVFCGSKSSEEEKSFCLRVEMLELWR